MLKEKWTRSSLLIFGGGDVEQLERLYSSDIEVKVFNGLSSLRRKLTLCNTEKITTITSGLKMKERKEGDSLIDKKSVQDERHLRVMIKKCMNKEFHGATKSEVDFIYKLLKMNI